MAKPRAAKKAALKKPAKKQPSKVASAPKARKAAKKAPARAKKAAPKKVAAPKRAIAAKKTAAPKRATKQTLRTPRISDEPTSIPRPPVTQPSGPSGGAAASRVRDSSHRAAVSPSVAPALMQLGWEEAAPAPLDPLAERWLARGEGLLTALSEHGCDQYEYRADMKEGRFIWVDDDGIVGAEARLRVLCSWSKSTNALVMGWADPLVKGVSVARVDGMDPEDDDVSEEGAWRAAMLAADAAGAQFLYRVTAPHAWYFLALDGLTFAPTTVSFSPSTPVSLVLRSLDETRTAIESRAEPAVTVRERLNDVGSALLREAAFAYRDTDWVARLERTGKCILGLGSRLPRQSFSSVAAGRVADEFLSRESTLDLSQALVLLEDEWALFDG